MSGITIETKVHFRRGRRSKKEIRAGQKREPVSAGRIPRLARLMALAIRFDGLVRDGVITDYAELARLGHVTRARMTQITNLLHLAPDIQEAILFLSPVEHGRDPIAERHIRQIVAVPDWPCRWEKSGHGQRPQCNPASAYRGRRAAPLQGDYSSRRC